MAVRTVDRPSAAEMEIWKYGNIGSKAPFENHAVHNNKKEGSVHSSVGNLRRDTRAARSGKAAKLEKAEFTFSNLCGYSAGRLTIDCTYCTYSKK